MLFGMANTANTEMKTIEDTEKSKQGARTTVPCKVNKNKKGFQRSCLVCVCVCGLCARIKIKNGSTYTYTLINNRQQRNYYL